VRHNSVNPDLVPGAPGEGAVAAFLCQYCRSAGLEAEVREVDPGRASVLARLRGRGARPALLLNGHLDTVGVDGMTIDPFEPVIREGRLYGRGAFDMKGGVAAMVEATLAAAADGPPPGDVLLAMVADEEYASRGTEAVLREVTAGAAVVTEPTGLDICIAHQGFAWFTIETAGRAAHGSRFDEGVDAIARMGRVLVALERLEREVYPRHRHPLLGRPSVHASLIAGGQGLSTYPDRCRLQVERRTLPAEGPEEVAAEVEGLLAELRRADPSFEATWFLSLFRPGLEIPAQAPLVRTLRRVAAAVLGREPALVGASPGVGSAVLAAAASRTGICGPAGSGAHAAEEWVDLASLAATAEVLARLIATGAEEG